MTTSTARRSILGRTFTVNEKTLAGYAQLNYKFEVGDVGIDGQVGMRGVQTKDHVKERGSSPADLPAASRSA